MKEVQENPTDRPDPLDDYSQVSDEAIEKRVILRVVLGACFAGCFSLLVYFGMEFLKEGHPRYFSFLLGSVVVAICVLYLVLVRIDAGRWSPVHPMIRPGLIQVCSRLRNNPPVLILLIILDTALVLAILLSSSSGWITMEGGWYSLGLILGAGLFANGILIQALGRKDWEE